MYTSSLCVHFESLFVIAVEIQTLESLSGIDRIKVSVLLCRDRNSILIKYSITYNLYNFVDCGQLFCVCLPVLC